MEVIKMHRPNYPPLEPIINYMERNLLLQQTRVSEILEKSLRENAIPPIKGEITKGKIRYRRIRLIVEYDGTKYLEQRGKRISERIKPQGLIMVDVDHIPLDMTPEEFLKEWKNNNGILRPCSPRNK